MFVVQQITYELNDTMGTEDGFSDDDTMDPDWVKTPMHRPKRKTTVRIYLIICIFTFSMNHHCVSFFRL